MGMNNELAIKRGKMPASQLTIREHFAMQALMGILANDGNPHSDEAISCALFQADELLVQLHTRHPT